MSLRDIAARLVITKGAKKGQHPSRCPGSKQHKINDWLPCPGVVLPGLVGCLDPA